MRWETPVKSIEMFHPYITRAGRRLVQKTLKTKWLAQGPKVDEFEERLKEKFGRYVVTVNSGTSALTLAYHLLGLKAGDEVIVPVLTCSATNLPLYHMGVKLIFADINDKLNPQLSDIKSKITPNTKAVVNVHLNGNLNDLNDLHLPVVGDMAQCHLRPPKNEDIACYSFQAIKTITCGDGGMLVFKDKHLYDRAKKLRWFGIDREQRHRHAERLVTLDMKEAGWKYHLNDIAASIGLGSLAEYDKNIAHAKRLKQLYRSELDNIDGLVVIGGTWTFPLLVEERDRFQARLKQYGIETTLVQSRNDILTPFGKKRQDLPNMDFAESRYVHLPLHRLVSEGDVEYICKVIKGGW